MSRKIEEDLRNQLAKLNKNKKISYMIQFALLLINFMYFFTDISNLTFVTVSLFTVPIVVDLYYEYFANTQYKIIRNIILAINLLIIGITLSALFVGLFIDKMEYFQLAEKAYFFAGLKIDKGYLLLVMFLDCFIPLILQTAILDLGDVSVEQFYNKGYKRNKGEVGSK